MFVRNKQLLLTVGFLIGSLILFSWGISSQEVTGFDSRFYLFALEMMQNGASWFPTTYQQSYPDYPGTSTFVIWVLAHLFGGLNKGVAVLPSNILAAITLFMTYSIGAMYSKRWGWYAVFFLLLTLPFLKNARAISLDLYPTAITAICFYLLCHAEFAQKKLPWKWIYLLLVGGFLFRGPIGFVMPAGIVCSYLLFNQQYKKNFIFGLNALILLFLCSGLLLFLAYQVGGQSFMRNVLQMEVLGRMSVSSLPYYFYFTSSFLDYALSFPLAFLLLFSLGYAFLSQKSFSIIHGKTVLQLMGWVLIILIGMSIPGDKKIRYLLPFTPAVALLAAYPFAFTDQKYFFIAIRLFVLRFFLFLPCFFLLGLTILLQMIFVDSIQHSYYFISLFLICMQLSNSCLYFFSFTENWRTTIILLIATLTFVVMFIQVIEPMELDLDKTHDFVTQVETQRKEKNARLVFYKECTDGLAIKYLINMPNREQPLFIDNEKVLFHFKQPAFFITSTDYFLQLNQDTKRYQIIQNGKIGHSPMVVFSQK